VDGWKGGALDAEGQGRIGAEMGSLKSPTALHRQVPVSSNSATFRRPGHFRSYRRSFIV
jgi:hypothetical protein